jgi:palmitoyl-[glycerolipid] 3-(E)-desaturase
MLDLQKRSGMLCGVVNVLSSVTMKVRLQSKFVTISIPDVASAADLGSGVYHWAVDNYGSSETPLVGTQIAAFQGHHQRPWVITQREFCNNCSLTFKPAGIAAALLLSISLLGASPAPWDVFAATAIVFIAMSQQLHAWSHMKKSELPRLIVSLQDLGLIISRKAHGAHHKSPFNINYCIVSGWCNPLLDCGIMFNIELFIKNRLGVSPRGWSAPLAEWRELAPPESLHEHRPLSTATTNGRV